MNFIIIRLFVSLLSLLLILPVTVVFAQDSHSKTGYPVLASRHKHSPAPQKNSLSSSHHSNVVNLVDSGQAKRKPARQRIALSPSGLQKKISSKSVIVMDAQTGETLYAIAPDVPRQPASTIKVLTGLIALNSLNKNAMVYTSRRASSMPRSKVYLRKGKSYAAKDLINAVLMASANDASVALAEKIAGSEKAFAELMTQKARSFGACNTTCKTATGLTVRGQKSTARDLAVVFNQAMQDHEFAKRMTWKKVGTQFGKTIRSHNKALWKVDGAEGGKTGYTRAARQTYVGKFRRGQDELVVAIMGSETMWHDIYQLVEYGFNKKQKTRVQAAAKQPGIQAADTVPLVSRRPLAALQVLSDNKKVSKL